MTIITISRGSYCRGAEIAETTAKLTGYQCISREVTLEAADRYSIPEIEIIRAIHDAPSFLERFGHSREQYVAQVKAKMLAYAKQDGIIYHGLAGHFFLPGVSHVLKVRLIAAMEDRARQAAEHQGISEKAARDILIKEDDERRRWSRELIGIDTNDATLYDLVIHVGPVSPEIAAKIIVLAAEQPGMAATDESQQALNDLALAAEVEARLAARDPFARVSARDGVVTVRTEAELRHASALKRDVGNMVRQVEGVHDVLVEITTRSRNF